MRPFNRHAFLGMDDDREDPRRFREDDPRAGYAPVNGGLDHDPTFYVQRPEERSVDKRPEKAGATDQSAPANTRRPPGEERTGSRDPPSARSDTRVREDVRQALEDDDEIDASGIEVIVSSGEVRLRGTMVGDRDDSSRVEDIVYEIAGVTDVINEIGVRREEQPEAEATP